MKVLSYHQKLEPIGQETSQDGNEERPNGAEKGYKILDLIGRIAIREEQADRHWEILRETEYHYIRIHNYKPNYLREILRLTGNNQSAAARATGLTLDAFRWQIGFTEQP